MDVPETEAALSSGAGIRGCDGSTSCCCAWGSLLGCEGPHMELGAGRLQWPLRWAQEQGSTGEPRANALTPAPHPGGGPSLGGRLSVTSPGGPVLSDPEAGTLTCSACLPSSQKSFLSGYQNISPRAWLSYQQGRLFLKSGSPGGQRDWFLQL